jgi:curved DNA-binding protein CbpA
VDRKAGVTAQRSFYDVLEVGREASLDEIRGAFRRLARERHPDRFQGPVRESAERAFQEITEAYNVLSDPDRRARYDQSLAGSVVHTAKNPREIARALLAKAVAAAKAGQLDEAVECFTQALAHDSNSAKAHYLYGTFLGQVGRVDEALRQLDQAVKLEPNDVRYLVDASKMFARAKMVARAARLAQMASTLSPDDPSVITWLQELQAGSGRDGGGT